MLAHRRRSQNQHVRKLACRTGWSSSWRAGTTLRASCRSARRRSQGASTYASQTRRHSPPSPRVIYALLRCTLLASAGPVATDRAAAMHALWSSLGPDALLRAIHPMLVAFDDPESDKHTREPLSRDSLASDRGRVFLMDAYNVIVILYRAAATSASETGALPFPPPAGSALRALVRRLVSARGVAPEVRQRSLCALASARFFVLRRTVQQLQYCLCNSVVLAECREGMFMTPTQ